MTSNAHALSTSHPHLLTSKDADIKFYQKMEMVFAPKGAKSRKKI